MSAESYLEHFGKRGMKWGVRKEKPRKAVVVREQTAIKVTGYTATAFGARAVGKIIASRTGSTPLAVLAVASTAIVGHQLTKSAVDRYGDRQMSQLTANTPLPPGAPRPQGVKSVADRRKST